MKITLLIILSVSSLLAGKEAISLTQPDWKVVHTQGKLHFVVVNKDGGLDKNTYRQAMDAVCPQGKACQALFWRRGDEIPQTVPLSYTNFSRLMAFYSVQADSSTAQQRWNCRVFTGDLTDVCLNEAAVDAVIQP